MRRGERRERGALEAHLGVAAGQPWLIGPEMPRGMQARSSLRDEQCHQRKDDDRQFLGSDQGSFLREIGMLTDRRAAGAIRSRTACGRDPLVAPRG
jgi:hypothetical protein